MKNQKLRDYLHHNQISQEKFGKTIKLSQPEISSVYKFFENTDTELSEKYQQKIIEMVKEAN